MGRKSWRRHCLELRTSVARASRCRRLVAPVLLLSLPVVCFLVVYHQTSLQLYDLPLPSQPPATSRHLYDNASFAAPLSMTSAHAIHNHEVTSRSIKKRKVKANEAGELGRPVLLKEERLSAEERRRVRKGWESHNFNEYVSSLISLHRSLPDLRHSHCRAQTYPSNLPAASVIICFHNEAWSTLLRTLHSVLERSPHHLLAEVILVDDNSEHEHLHKPLEDYVALLERVRLVRTGRRLGLMKARLLGLSLARAAVLVFLDSHCECFPGWLEPLLAPIANDSSVSVTPTIDVIKQDNFAVEPADDNIGIFLFPSLSFDWSHITQRIAASRHSPADPIMSPTMAGGLFAINKEFFIHLGTYDPGLELWGGENLELSFKLWMCGGRILISPCSHVGHVFRDKSPYLRGRSLEVVQRNTARVAQVWLDDYRHFFFGQQPYSQEVYGSVREQEALRQRLGCQSFHWYVQHVYPEVHLPGTGERFGLIKSVATDLCLSLTKDANDSPLQLLPCRPMTVTWESTTLQEVRFYGFCLEFSPFLHVPLSRRCRSDQTSQLFHFSQGRLYHPMTESCLSVGEERDQVVMATCDDSEAQQWVWPLNPHPWPVPSDPDL